MPAALAAPDAVQALGAALGCGTQCGSCRPELRRIVAQAAAVAAEVST